MLEIDDILTTFCLHKSPTVDPKRSEMASTIDPKTKRKLTWGLSENHEKMIRMQGARTSKIMFPCGG